MRRLWGWVGAMGRVRCPLCRERTRYLQAHLHVEHAGEAS